MSEEEKKDAQEATPETTPEAEAPKEAEVKEEPKAEETKPEETKEEAKTEEAPAESKEPTKDEQPTEDAAPTADEVPTDSNEAPAEPEEDVLEEDLSGYKGKLVNLQELKPGMTIRLHEKIKDVSPKGEERERIQIFEGMIMAIRGAGLSRTMTLRKVSKGHGVEKIYPINSPVIDKIELVKQAKVRRAKLWFLANPKRRFRRKLKEEWIMQGAGKKKKRRRR